MTLAGHRAPSGRGAERGAGTKVTSGPRNGFSLSAFGSRRWGTAEAMISTLPALMAPQVPLDRFERSELPRGE